MRCTTMNEPRECVACSKSLPRDGRIMTCTECTFSYHLGRTCSGIAESTFTTMGATKREKCRCKTCRTRESRTSVGDCWQVQSTDFVKQIGAVNQNIDPLLSLKENVHSLLQLPTKVDSLLLLKPVVEKLTDTVAEMQSSVEYFSAKYDSLLTLVTTNEKVVKDLQAEVGSLKACVSDQALQLQRIQTD